MAHLWRYLIGAFVMITIVIFFKFFDPRILIPISPDEVVDEPITEPLVMTGGGCPQGMKRYLGSCIPTINK